MSRHLLRDMMSRKCLIAHTLILCFEKKRCEKEKTPKLFLFISPTASTSSLIFFYPLCLIFYKKNYYISIYIWSNPGSNVRTHASSIGSSVCYWLSYYFLLILSGVGNKYYLVSINRDLEYFSISRELSFQLFAMHTRINGFWKLVG